MPIKKPASNKYVDKNFTVPFNKAYVTKWYNFYNKEVFNNEMPKAIALQLKKRIGGGGKSGSIMGRAVFRPGEKDPLVRFTIQLNTTLLLDKERFATTLLHEMIHIRIYKKAADLFDDNSTHRSLQGIEQYKRLIGHQHGPLFLEENNRIEIRTRLKIPIIDNDMEYTKLSQFVYFVAVFNHTGIATFRVQDKLTKQEFENVCYTIQTNTTLNPEKICYVKTKNSAISNLVQSLTNKNTLAKRAHIKMYYVDSLIMKSIFDDASTKVVTEKNIKQLEKDLGHESYDVVLKLKRLDYIFDSFVVYLQRAILYSNGNSTREANVDKLQHIIMGINPKLFTILEDEWYKAPIEAYFNNLFTSVSWFKPEELELIHELKAGPNKDARLKMLKDVVGVGSVGRYKGQVLYTMFMKYYLKNALIPRNDLHKYMTYITHF